MEVEQEELMKLVFGDSPPDNWQENPEFSVYLAEMGNMGVGRISAEPERVAEELSQLQTQIQDLAFSNYKTFIQTSHCSRDIFKEFQTTESHLHQLLDKLPTFSQNCQVFQTAAADISRHRRLTSLTLSNHTNLLEILELPQLMETVVRNQHYEEALELHSYVVRLAKKQPNVPIIEGIAKHVAGSMKLMLQQLLAQLRSPVQLPQCLKVVSYLRRMDVFTETELRLKFLQARESWLASVVSGVPKDDAYVHVTRTMELMRVHLFDIVTQYRAIFSEEESLIVGGLDCQFDNRVLFSSWLDKKIQEFLDVLSKDLEAGVSSLESVLGQAMYFGLSFSRVGCDFRPLLVPIFVSAVRAQFDRALQTDKLKSQVSSLLGRVQLARVPAAQPWLGNDPSQPPVQLLDYLPLAEICNAVLAGLNEIRLCAPLSVCQHVTRQVHSCLQAGVNLLVDYQTTGSPGWSNKEAAGFENLCSAFSLVLLPYLQKCLASVFSPSEISTVLGYSVTDLKNQGIGHLDSEALLEPLKPFLPEANQTHNSEEEAGTQYVADRMEELALAVEEVNQQQVNQQQVNQQQVNQQQVNQQEVNQQQQVEENGVEEDKPSEDAGPLPEDAPPSADQEQVVQPNDVQVSISEPAEENSTRETEE